MKLSTFLCTTVFGISTDPTLWKKSDIVPIGAQNASSMELGIVYPLWFFQRVGSVEIPKKNLHQNIDNFMSYEP